MNQILHLLADFWIGYKVRLADFVGLTNDAMHVHGSILILFGSAIILRRRPDSVSCWLIVFAAELFNEFADLQGLAPGEASIKASIHDLYNTMFWPTVILVLGRFLFPPVRQQDCNDVALSSDLANQGFEKTTTV